MTMGMRQTGKISDMISMSLASKYNKPSTQPITVTGSFTTIASGAVMVFCNEMVSELMRDIKSPVRD